MGFGGRVKSTHGELFIIEGGEVRRRYGSIVEDRAFLYPKGKSNGRAEMVSASFVFTTAPAANSFLKRKIGYAVTHTNRVMRVRVAQTTSGLVAYDNHGTRMWNRNVFTTRKAALDYALKDALALVKNCRSRLGKATRVVVRLQKLGAK
jgi:hypothetical protein